MPLLNLRYTDSDDDLDSLCKLMDSVKDMSVYIATDPEQNKCPDIEQLVLKGMLIDPRYQRNRQTYVEKIAHNDNFDPFSVGVLTVCIRPDGKKAIIDGQQRWFSLGLRQIPIWNCNIVRLTTVADEAAMFLRMNGGEGTGKRVHVRDLFRAGLCMGVKIVREINEAVAAAQMSITYNSGCKDGKGIGCIGKLVELCDGYNRDILEATLKLNRLIWNEGQAEFKQQGVIHALLRLYLDHQKVFDKNKLYKPAYFKNDASGITRKEIIGKLRNVYVSDIRNACHGTDEFEEPYIQLVKAINKGRKSPNVMSIAPSDRSLPMKSAKPLSRHVMEEKQRKKNRKTKPA